MNWLAVGRKFYMQPTGFSFFSDGSAMCVYYVYYASSSFLLLEMTCGLLSNLACISRTCTIFVCRYASYFFGGVSSSFFNLVLLVPSFIS